MKTRSAVVSKAPTPDSPGRYELIEVELDAPRQGELLVKMAAAGLCHSDDHMTTGDQPPPSFPYIGGHEGAGVVQRVGPGTVGFAPGDHVVFCFLPACGRCRWCASGMQNLCDLGQYLQLGSRPEDPTSFRVHLPDGTNVGQFCSLGAFSEYTTVSVNSVVKIDRDLPLDKACLLGCGVGTGWGAAVNSAQTRPGDTVIVMGVGGIGINSVQGAAHAGATNVIAVDPVGFKRDTAMRLGATHAFADMDAAADFARAQTDGQGANSAIVTVGVIASEHVGQAFAAVRKGGTVAVVGLGNLVDEGIPVPLWQLTLFQKRIQGSLFGQMNPSWDILRQAQMYRDGVIKLDELVTRTYPFEQIAQGYDDLHAGINIRGVVVFDA